MIRLARSPILVSILFLFVFDDAIAQQRNGLKPDNRPRTATISGRVTIGGKPAANVKIVVAEITDPSGLGSAKIDFVIDGMPTIETYDAVTDADGRYRVPNLPIGKYQAEAMLGCCVREKRSSNAHWGEKLVEAIALDDGETRANVDFALVRGGVITGRVVDADGRPLIARVVSLQFVDEMGQKQDYQNYINWESRQTDDRGVYRIYGLRAGRYLANAGGMTDGGLASGAGNKYPLTWHPDAADANQAKIIEVTEGGEVTGVDIRLGVAKKTYEALGRVVDDETGKPVVGVGLICVRSAGEEGAALSQFGGNQKTDDQGNFRFEGLTPGRYQIGFMDYESFMTGKGSSYFSDGVTFEIQGADVSGLEIKAKQGATISGIAKLEDADPAAKSGLAQAMVLATSTPASGAEADETVIAFGMMPSFALIGSDGNFIITGIRPGKVTLQVQSNTDPSIKMTRIEYNGGDASQGIPVSERENIRGVRVFLGKGACVIRGQVQVKGGALPEGWSLRVMARNENGSNGSPGFVNVDSKGKFMIDALLPGEYTLVLMAVSDTRVTNGQTTNQTDALVEQKVTVVKGQETQVSMTIDLNKKALEEK